MNIAKTLSKAKGYQKDLNEAIEVLKDIESSKQYQKELTKGLELLKKDFLKADKAKEKADGMIADAMVKAEQIIDDAKKSAKEVSIDAGVSADKTRAEGLDDLAVLKTKAADTRKRIKTAEQKLEVLDEQVAEKERKIIELDKLKDKAKKALGM